MELKHLQQHVRSLATLPETADPVISCYLELDEGRIRDQVEFDAQIRILRQGIPPCWQRSFEESMAEIEAYLLTNLKLDARGIALFARAGSAPFMKPLQFRAPLPTWVALDSTPNIYHLVELKDTYHRFVVLFLSEQQVRILEVNLGEVTQELWAERPELRARVGREWSKAHFQDHRRDRTRRFIKDQIQVLEKRVSAGGYSHLVLAGPPAITGQIRNLLPKQLLSRLIDVVSASSRTPVSEVVRLTLASFVEAEERESRSVAEQLLHELLTGGLAVCGTGPTYQAFRTNRGDTLVLSKDYEPEPVQVCEDCGLLDSRQYSSGQCSFCETSALQTIDVKAALVRMAEQQHCKIEVVESSEGLRRQGGVGCLLRYRLHGDYK